MWPVLPPLSDLNPRRLAAPAPVEVAYEGEKWTLTFTQNVQEVPAAFVVRIVLAGGSMGDGSRSALAARERQGKALAAGLTAAFEAVLKPGPDQPWQAGIAGKWYTTCSDWSLSEGKWQYVNLVDEANEMEQATRGRRGGSGLPGGSVGTFLDLVFPNSLSTVRVGTIDYAKPFTDGRDRGAASGTTTWYLAAPDTVGQWLVGTRRLFGGA